MNVPFVIAKRYLFSKGNRNVINIISGIAATGVGIGTLAMIIILSVFNGLETLVTDLYTSVDPDIRVSPVIGKTFSLDSLDLETIRTWEDVAMVAPVLEETVFLQYEEHQSIVVMRGIPDEYLPKLGLDEHLITGELLLNYMGTDAAVLGYGVADNLGLFDGDGLQTISVYAAKRDGIKSTNPESKFISQRIYPSAIVGLNPEFDFKYFYTSDSFASGLLQYSNRASYLEIDLVEGADEQQVKEDLSLALGDKFKVKTRIELNEVMYKTYATEKWVTFFILMFIMVVATFNLIGSLAMLILEKKNDIRLLRSLGSTAVSIRKLFLYEGLLITVYGAAIGMIIGLVIVLLQQYVGFFPLEGGLVEYYPVELRWFDVLIVSVVSLGIGTISSFIPLAILKRIGVAQTAVAA